MRLIFSILVKLFVPVEFNNSIIKLSAISSFALKIFICYFFSRIRLRKRVKYNEIFQETSSSDKLYINSKFSYWLSNVQSLFSQTIINPLKVVWNTCGTSFWKCFLKYANSWHNWRSLYHIYFETSFWIRYLFKISPLSCMDCI